MRKIPDITLFMNDTGYRSLDGRHITHEQFDNAFGYDQTISTLTTIKRDIVKQKFYQIPFADYMPVIVGEGAFSQNLLAWRTFITGGSFESGVINTGSGESRLATTDMAVDAVNIPIKNWAKDMGYNTFQLQMLASSPNNISLIEQKEKARKMEWDLGIQKIAFLGMESDVNIRGLLTLANVNSNTVLITEPISTMTESEFSTFVASLIEAYRNNCYRTAMPDTFIIPESDYNGLAAPVSPTFPVINKLKYLLDMFKIVTENPNFKIKPLAYAMETNADNIANTNLAGINRYVLTRQDPEALQFNLPLDYTTTVPMSYNNFNWNTACYGQFTGVTALRSAETLYLDWATSST